MNKMEKTGTWLICDGPILKRSEKPSDCVAAAAMAFDSRGEIYGHRDIYNIPCKYAPYTCISTRIYGEDEVIPDYEVKYLIFKQGPQKFPGHRLH